MHRDEGAVAQSEPPRPKSHGTFSAMRLENRFSSMKRRPSHGSRDRKPSLAISHGSLRFIMHSFARRLSFLLLSGIVATLAFNEPAAAQSANVEKVLQNIVDALTGNVAKLLATLAIIITGMSWMFGYLDLRRAGYVILGVAILFGAAEIVSTLTGK